LPGAKRHYNHFNHCGKPQGVLFIAISFCCLQHSESGPNKKWAQ